MRCQIIRYNAKEGHEIEERAKIAPGTKKPYECARRGDEKKKEDIVSPASGMFGLQVPIRGPEILRRFRREK